jgi:uncharacterized protein YjbI with pentapeptide repeats
MNKKELTKILNDHKEWLNNNGGTRAVLTRADLTRADLRGAVLRGAVLTRAVLRDADLTRADLRGAVLTRADLRGAVLTGADLTRAVLRDADLTRADLTRADLTDAVLDYSCWPLWCGSKNVKVDAKIAAQLAAHFCVLDCDDKDYQKARKAILKFAQTSHRAADLGLL